MNAATCTQEKHNELKLDRVRWAGLKLIGHQHVEADETGPAETYEYRNCSCGSTLAININTEISQ